MNQVHPVAHEENNQTQATFTISHQSGDIKVDNDVARRDIKVDNDVARLTHTQYQYLKLDSDTTTLEWDKIKPWGLKEPDILICVTGERETSDSPGDLTTESLLLRYLLKFALRADAWIITGETNTDFIKRLGETALEYGMLPSGRIPILGIVSLDRVARKLSENEGYHTHIVLIDNTSQQTSVSLEVEFCHRIQRGLFNKDKSCLIFLVKGGDRESIRNAVCISTPNIFLRGSGGDDDISVLENGPGTERTQGKCINTSTNHKEFPECLTLCELDIFMGSDSEVDKKLFPVLRKALRIDGKELIKLAITCNNMDLEEIKEMKTKDFQLQDQLEILEFAIVKNRFQLVQVLLDIGVNVNEISELQTHLYTEVNPNDMTIVKNVAEKARKGELREVVSFVQELAKRLEDASNDKTNKSKLPCKAAHFFFLWSLINNRMELARLFLKCHQEPIAAALEAVDVLKQLGKQNKTNYEQFKLKAKDFEKIGIDIVNSCYMQNEQNTLDLLNRKLKYWSESTCINIALTSRNKPFLSQPFCMHLIKKFWFGDICKGSSYKWIIVSTIIFPVIFCKVKFNDQTVDSHYSRSDATLNKKPEISKCLKLKQFYTAPVVIFIMNCLSHLAFLGLYSYVLVVVLSPSYHVTEGIVFFWVMTITLEEIRQICSGNSLSEPKGYFGNKWNWLDIAIIIDFIIGLVLRFIPKSECFETSRVLFSLNLIFFFFRFLHTLSATRTLGPMLTMIWKMFEILIKFLFILMTFIAAYAIASEAILYPETNLSWKLLYYLPRRAYWNLYGELFLDELEGQSSCTNDPALYSDYSETRCPSEVGKVVGPVLMGIYVLMSNILLMNLLIALLSYSIQKVYDNANMHWSFQRLKLIQEYQSRPFLPPPFIIIIHVYRLIKLMKERICKTTSKSCKYDEELARWERCMVRNFIDSQDAKNAGSSKEHLTEEAKCKQSKIAKDAEVHSEDNKNEDNKARNNNEPKIQATSRDISELREEIKSLKEKMDKQIQQTQFSEFSRLMNMLKASVDELKTVTARQVPPPAVYSPPDKSFLEAHEFPPTSWIAEQTTSSPLQVQYQDASLMQEEINQMYRSEEMGRESGPVSIASHYQVLPPIQLRSTYLQQKSDLNLKSHPYIIVTLASIENWYYLSKTAYKISHP